MEFRTFGHCDQDAADIIMSTVPNKQLLELHQPNCKLNQSCFVFSDIELSEITKFNEHDNCKYGNGSIVGFTKQIPDTKIVSNKNSKGKTIASVVVGLVICLALSVGVPLALQLRASSLLEARLSFIRRLLIEIPLVDGYWMPDNLTSSISDAKKGLVGALLWPVRIPCGAQHLDAVQLALEGMDVAIRTANAEHETLRIVENSTEMEKAHSDGVIGAVLGIQGGHALGASLAVLRSLYLLGARFVSLTQGGCDTPWAEAAQGLDPDRQSTHDKEGISLFGESIIREMNRLGMLLEAAGVSEGALHRALSLSKAPCLLANAVPAALCNYSMNMLSDEVLAALPENGGVVMVNVDRCGEHPLSLKEAISYVNHVRGLAGVNHVGLSGAPHSYPLLLAELSRERQWGNKAIKKLVGGNLVRALREVEALRDKAPLNEEWVPQDEMEGHAYCRYPGA